MSGAAYFSDRSAPVLGERRQWADLSIRSKNAALRARVFIRFILPIRRGGPSLCPPQDIAGTAEASLGMSGCVRRHAVVAHQAAPR